MQKKEEEGKQTKQSKQAQEDQYHKKRELEGKMSKHDEKEKQLLNEEKKLNEELAIARSIMTEPNKRLATAVSTRDMNEVATASALIDSAQKRFYSSQKSITSVQEQYANRLGKQEKYDDLNKETKKKRKKCQYKKFVLAVLKRNVRMFLSFSLSLLLTS